MAPAQVSAGRALHADVPVRDVRVSIVGLHGDVYMAAERAGEIARSSRTIENLDAKLRGKDASNLASLAAERGTGVIIEVAPGPETGIIDVTFKGVMPHNSTSLLTADTRINRSDLATVFELKTNNAVKMTDEGAPVHIGLGITSNFGREGVCGTIGAVPPLVLPRGWSPSIECGKSFANMTESFGPRQSSEFISLAVQDAARRHTFRFRHAERETANGSAASRLQTTPFSLQYNFSDDLRKEFASTVNQPATVRAATLDLFGGFLFGDVGLARGQFAVAHSIRAFGTGLLTLSGSVGVAVPLDGREVPVEEKFYIGGVTGQGIGERLPAFAAHGIGPSGKRPKQASAADANMFSEMAATMRDAFKFGPGFSVERNKEPIPEEQPKEETLSDRLGACTRGSFAATLQHPLPALGPVRLSTFGRATVASLADNPRNLASEARASLAIGLAAHLPFGAMLGFSHAVPFMQKEGDDIRRWQVWLSFGNQL